MSTAAAAGRATLAVMREALKRTSSWSGVRKVRKSARVSLTPSEDRTTPSPLLVSSCGGGAGPHSDRRVRRRGGAPEPPRKVPRRRQRHSGGRRLQPLRRQPRVSAGRLGQRGSEHLVRPSHDIDALFAWSRNPSSPVRYLSTAALGDELVLEGKVIGREGRLIFVEAEVRRRDDGVVVARGSQRMFAFA